MKTTTAFSAAILGLVSLASAHMEMKQPAPFRSKFNSFTTDVDYSMTNPLDKSGSDFPCKGYQSLSGTPQGQSVATWAPGSQQTFVVTGQTIHAGGSCQASLSYDNGATWTVIHSYIGNCPAAVGDTSYDFTIPNDTPAGSALFAWSWFNNLGNREMYMNCAAVTIGSAKRAVPEVEARAPTDPFASRPAMFVANVGNGCATVETKDLEFPQPGPDITRQTAEGSTSGPTGTCAAASKVPAEGFVTVTKSAEKLPAATKPPVSDKVEIAAECDTEGEWNCVGGNKYQRCASGTWSALEDVAPGTACNPGKSNDFPLVQRRSSSKKHRRVRRAPAAAEGQS